MKMKNEINDPNAMTDEERNAKAEQAGDDLPF